MGGMNGTVVEEPNVRLRVEYAETSTDGREVRLGFNRPLTAAECEQFTSLPPAPEIARSLGKMVKLAMTFEIVARLCRAYVLSGVLLSEGPAVTQWLRRYIDGDDTIGPLGAPLPWPDALLETGAMLREWGFERSPNGWVARAGSHGAPAGTRPS